MFSPCGEQQYLGLVPFDNTLLPSERAFGRILKISLARILHTDILSYFLAVSTHKFSFKNKKNREVILLKKIAS